MPFDVGWPGMVAKLGFVSAVLKRPICDDCLSVTDVYVLELSICAYSGYFQFTRINNKSIELALDRSSNNK